MFPANGEWLPAPHLEIPTGVIGLTVFISYIVLFALLTYSIGPRLNKIQIKRWLLIIGLCLLAGIAGALGNAFLQQVAISTGLEGIVDYPLVIPFIGLLLAMLAAIWVNPAAAFLVAIAYSIPYSIYHTHQVYSVFSPVFVAVLVAVLMQLRMEGRLYKWLRTPVAAGVQGAIFYLLLLALTTFAIVSVSQSVMSASNTALKNASSEAVPIFIMAIVAGLIISLIKRWIPVGAQQKKPIWLPYSDNLKGRVISTFILITVLLTFLLIVVGYGLARPSLIGSTVDQIADEVQFNSTQVDEYHGSRTKLLEWAAADIETITNLESENSDDRHDLDLLLNSFESIAVVNRDQSVLAQFPSDDGYQLSDIERAAVSEVHASGNPAIAAFAAENQDNHEISFIVNVPQEDAEGNVIIGRVSEDDIRQLLESQKSNIPGSFPYVRYELGGLTILPTSASSSLELADKTEIKLLDGRATINAVGYALDNSDLRYFEFSEAFEQDWSSGLVMPSDEILASGLVLVGKGIGIFALGIVFAAVMILLVVDSASHVLHRISRQTQQAARMGIESPVKEVGNSDEIGGLATAFRRLQMANRQQWEEQRLLLSVSEELATTFDLSSGTQTILNAALIGMRSSGAQILILRNDDRKILTFTQPPDVHFGANIGEALLQIMQDRSELICRNSQEIQSSFATIDLDLQTFPKALLAISIKTDELHQGLIWVWRKDARHWKQSQLRFLRTLASNTSTLIAKAKLLARVENGRRRLSAILSSTADAVLATDDSNRVMLLNSAMEHYFDINMQEVLGKRVEAVIQNNDLVKALSGDGSDTVHIEVNASDGLVLDGRVSTLSYNGGTSAGSVVVLRDVTRFKELDQMKTDFVANVSHDLRSPLTQMLNYSQLIPMDGPLTENQTMWLSRVERAVFNMTELIEVLLDLNRLESGIALNTVPFRIEDLFQSILADYEAEADANGLSLTYEVIDGLPVIEGDVEMIRQALRNIVSNAIKYAPDSGPLTMTAEAIEDELIICVTDNGPGIAESEVTRVFEKFYRTQNQDNGSVPGRGLGLALVKSIAERHGGRVWCDSQLMAGCRFYMALPLESNGYDPNQQNVGPSYPQ